MDYTMNIKTVDAKYDRNDFRLCYDIECNGQRFFVSENGQTATWFIEIVGCYSRKLIADCLDDSLEQFKNAIIKFQTVVK